MKRWLPTFSLIAALFASGAAHAQDFRYGWTISDSAVDPFVNTGAPNGTVDNQYLWFFCSTAQGLSAADFALTTDPPGAYSILGFNTSNGFLNAGSATDLLLAVGGCPTGPVLAGSWLVLHNSAGSMCLTNGATYPTPVAVDCDPAPLAHECDYIGYDDNGSPCQHFVTGSALCQTTSVDGESWGSIKSLYR